MDLILIFNIFQIKDYKKWNNKLDIYNKLILMDLVIKYIHRKFKNKNDYFFFILFIFNKN